MPSRKRVTAALSALAFAAAVLTGCGTSAPEAGPSPEALGTAVVSPTALPQGWPLAIPEGSKILVSRNGTDPDGRPIKRVELETQALGADVVRFFDQQLKGAGFTVSVRDDQPGKTTISYTAPGQIASLGVDEAGGTTEVRLEITDAATGSVTPSA